MTDEPLRWGVIGVSTMVGRLAVLPALAESTTADIVAIASRDPEKARIEALRFGAARHYASYQELVEDPAVEAVYIPLPNSLHEQWTVACLEAGKHVLCEKPLACDARQAARMRSVAARNGRLLMEAHMTTFHSRYGWALELAASGGLGQLRHIRSQFTFTNSDPDNHRWLPELGGGAILDVGVYCLDPILRIAGAPRTVSARRVLTNSGVDSTFAGWLEFDDGLTASLLASFELPESQDLEISGTDAVLKLDRAFTAGPADGRYSLMSKAGQTESGETSANNSYLSMVEHFAAAARTRSALGRPVEASVQCLEVLDRLRDAAG